jgi:hypothetical protein
MCRFEMEAMLPAGFQKAQSSSLLPPRCQMMWEAETGMFVSIANNESYFACTSLQSKRANSNKEIFPFTGDLLSQEPYHR